mgnify:CR=1 FL=1
MSITREILLWAQGLLPWQSDAVSRLLVKQSLTADDIDDLFALLKSEHGIVDPKGRIPRPLSADQIPASIPVETHVEILSIKNMRNVNAIAKISAFLFLNQG